MRNRGRGRAGAEGLRARLRGILPRGRAGAIAGVAGPVVLVAGLAVILLLAGGGEGEEDGRKRAAIIDQLSLTVPNEEFVAEATELLTINGYEVEYFKGEEVTVDLYRSLPERDFGLIVFRVHSTALISRGEQDVTSVSLFTGQAYSESLYREEQLQGRIGFAQYSEGSPKLFGITSDFVRDSMKGEFDGTVVLMMGCQGFINDRAAEAFAEKGARSFIGWDGLVSAQHTDEATELLLKHIVTERIEPERAIELTMADLGPDPTYGSELVSLP